MKVIKFGQYIKENLHDTPEEYVKIALKKIKNKIESFFEVENEENTWTIHFSSKNSPELLTLWRKAFDKSRGVRKAWVTLACDLGV